MISVQTTAFNLVDRGRSSTLVLIPGWASDHRIFEALDLEYNYLMPVNFIPGIFNESLLSELKRRNLTKVSLLGWSLGGFAASEFASEHSSYIEELILVSIRQKYNRLDLEQIKKYLNQNKKGYLQGFYSQCFHDLKYRDYFKQEFAEKYYKDLELDALIDGIDYLSKAEIKAEFLSKLEKIKIIHGEFDNIAPLAEAKKLSDRLSQAEFIVVNGMGHVPFLKQGFSKYIK